MPLCPNCKTEQGKRKNGACPSCGVNIQIHKGHWYREEIGSPTVALLNHFENNISDNLSKNKGAPVTYTIPQKGARYQRELVVAERLIKQADYDFDLAKDAIDILFKHPKFSWKLRTTLLYVENDYLVALAIAKADKAIRMEQAIKEAAAFSKAVEREDIFS